MPSQALCTMALLDDASNQKLLNLRHSLHAAGLGVLPLPTHITLGIYETAPQQPLLDWTADFARRQPPLEVHFSHIGMFEGGTCFCALLVNNPLLALHTTYHLKFDEASGSKGQRYMLAQRQWVPHCTLFMGSTQQARLALPILAEEFTAFSGRIEALLVGRYASTPEEYSPGLEIQQFPLTGGR